MIPIFRVRGWIQALFAQPHRRRSPRRSFHSQSESLEIRRLLSAPDAYENDNTAPAARTIGLNSAAQSHSLHVGTDVDWVKFVVNTPSQVVVTTAGTTGDTFLRLYGPNSSTVEIASDDDSGDGYFSRIEQSLAAGTYYAKVTEYGQNGTIDNYSLRVTASPLVLDWYESDDTYQTARTISVNGTVQSRSLHSGTDQDWAKFVIAEPMLVVAATAGQAGDTYLELYASDGTQRLASDDDSGVDSFSRIERPLPSAVGVAVYWSDDAGRLLGQPLHSSSTAATVGRHGPIAINGMNLEDRPRGATHLTLVLDPSNVIAERNEFNNQLEAIPNDPNDQISEAISLGINPLSTSVTQNGQLTYLDVDMYSLVVQAGQKMAFDFDSNTVLGTLRVFDSQGRQLHQGNGVWIKDGKGHLLADALSYPYQVSTLREGGSQELIGQSYLEITFPAAGRYYVGVSG